MSRPLRIEFAGALYHVMARGDTRAAILLDEEDRQAFCAELARVGERFVAGTQGQLRLFQLPPYSPDLDPDELVWNHLKRHKLGRLALSGPDHLKRHAMAFLRSLQKSPALVRGFFQHPTARYAA